MENPQGNDMIPKQEKGAHKDLKESITLENVDDADDLFVLAKERLLDINNWHKLSGGLSAEFILTDNHGKEAHRPAHTGDYIKIKIPGPGNETGDGYDWVHIEKILYDDYPDANGEAMSMQVRPAPSPLHKEETAHFFKEDATSTFNIERHGRIVLVHYHGRNEVPNTDAGGVINAARNVAVAIGGIMGLSDMQWQKLIKGLIEITE